MGSLYSHEEILYWGPLLMRFIESWGDNLKQCVAIICYGHGHGSMNASI